MDTALRERLDIFRAMDDVPEGVVDFVEDELRRADPGAALSDEQAGMFVSHMVMALSRLAQGDTSVEKPSDVAFAQVLQEAPAALDAAQALASRVQERFGLRLPEPEVQYVTIHLAVLGQHLSKESR